MTFEEAVEVLAVAEGKFHVVPNEAGDGLHVHYTGTDPEEEGRIAQALIVFGQLTAEALGGELEVRSLKTDNVHVASDKASPGAQEDE